MGRFQGHGAEKLWSANKVEDNFPGSEMRIYHRKTPLAPCQCQPPWHVIMSNLAPKLLFITDFLPDETLYAWVARYHLLSGNHVEDESRLQLFGSNKAGRHFHVPSHLINLSARTRLVLGRAVAIRGTTIRPQA